MPDNSSMFEEILSLENVQAKSSRCVYCKGTKMLCGKERCSVVTRFYSATKAMKRIDRLDLDGAALKKQILAADLDDAIRSRLAAQAAAAATPPDRLDGSVRGGKSLPAVRHLAARCHRGRLPPVPGGH